MNMPVYIRSFNFKVNGWAGERNTNLTGKAGSADALVTLNALLPSRKID